MNISTMIVWLVVGAISGTLAGRLVTFNKRGLGVWTNIVVGMTGAVVGGLLFWLLRIDFGLDTVQISLKDLVASFVGSLLCIAGLWIWRKVKKPAAPPMPRP